MRRRISLHLRIFVIRNLDVDLFGKRSTSLNLNEMSICIHFEFFVRPTPV